MTARPFENADVLYRILLDTTWSPGKATITGHDRAKNWQNSEAHGTAGASSTLHGDPIGVFQILFELAGDGYDTDFFASNDFDDWENFQKLIESTTSGPKPIALPIFHPALARQKITEVVNAGVGGMVYDDKGGASVVVKFQEYKPLKAKPPVPVTAGTAGATAVDPNAAAKAQLASLVAEAQKP